VADEQELTAQLRGLLKEMDWKGGTVVLALPDLTCRTGFQDFEELKGTPAEMRQLLCWRLRDRLPFSVEEARIDYQSLGSQGNGSRLWYLLARETVIAQYETLLSNVGLEPTRIITRGVALYRLHQAAVVGGKHLLFAPGPSSIVLIYVEEGVPRLWRALPWNGDGNPQDRNRQAQRLARELQETLGYLRDEMGVEQLDIPLLARGSNHSVAEVLAKACQVTVRSMPEPQDGLAGELLAPAGAALLHKAWRLEWRSPSTWPRPRS
jgi:hypothetical protein